jgi:hypothetical protein
MCVFEQARQGAGIEIRSARHPVAVSPIANESPVRNLLQVEEAGCPFNVREQLRVLLLEEREPPAAYEGEPQIPDKLLMVALADSKEVHDIPVDVIQDFHRRWLLVEKHLCTTREYLSVGGVRRK